MIHNAFFINFEYKWKKLCFCSKIREEFEFNIIAAKMAIEIIIGDKQIYELLNEIFINFSNQFFE